MVERDEFTTVADGDELSEGYYNGIYTGIRKDINRYSQTWENDNFVSNTGTLVYLNIGEALDFRGASGVYYTSDNGATWTQRSATSVGTTIYQNKSFPIAIITATHYTIDGGTTWTSFTAQTTKTNRAYAITNTGTLYAVGYTDLSLSSVVIYRSDNDGGTWTSKLSSSNTISGAIQRASIQAPVDEIFIYVVDTDDDDAATGLTFDDGATTEFNNRDVINGTGYLNAAIYIDANNYCFDSITNLIGNNGGHAIKWHADLTNGIDISGATPYKYTDSTKVYTNIISFTPEHYICFLLDTDAFYSPETISRYYDGTEVLLTVITSINPSTLTLTVANPHMCLMMSEDQDQNIGGTNSINKTMKKILVDTSANIEW